MKKILIAMLFLTFGHFGQMPAGDGWVEIEIGGQKIKIPKPNTGGKGKEGGKEGGLNPYAPTKKIVYGPLEFLSRETWWQVHHLDLLFGDDFFKRFDAKEGFGYGKTAAEPDDEALALLRHLTETAAWRGDFDGLTRKIVHKTLRDAPKKHLEALITAFTEADPAKDIPLRRGFLMVFADIPNAKAREAIATLANETENTSELGLAMRALGKMNDTTSHDLILKKVEDTALPLPVRTLGILALKNLLNPKSIERLTKMANDRAIEHQLRRACLLSLGAAGKTSFANLKDLIDSDPDNRIRATALRLIVIDDEVSEKELKILLRKLKGSDADLRGVAALALHQVASTNKDIKKAILTRLDKEKDIRARKAMAFAAGALSEGNKDLFALKKLFKKDQHEDVVWFTAVGLGLSGFEKGAALALKTSTRLKNPVALEGLCLCLGLIDGGEEHATRLKDMLADKGQPQVQATAALALGLRKQKDGLAPLDEALKADSSNVRAKAAVAEGMLDDLARDQAEKLAKTSNSETDRDARLMTALAAEMLGSSHLFANTLDKIYKNRSEMPVIDCD